MPPNPARGQVIPFAPENMDSRDVSGIPSHVSPLLLYTQAESGA